MNAYAHPTPKWNFFNNPERKISNHLERVLDFEEKNCIIKIKRASVRMKLWSIGVK